MPFRLNNTISAAKRLILGNNPAPPADLDTLYEIAESLSNQTAAYNTLLAKTKKYVTYRLLDKDTDTSVVSSLGGDLELPIAGTITGIGAFVDTAGTTSATTIDVKNGGTSIFDTLITIDSGEKSSRDAATPAVITEGSEVLALGDILTFDITTISTTAAKGLTIWIEIAV